MAAFLPLALLAAQTAAQNASASSLEGRWRSPGGNSIIEIAPCGASLCGTVAWASARAKRDSRKATAQLVGTPILTDLRDKGPGRWQGRLFIPDRNMRVTAKLHLVGPAQLKVSGCLAGKSLCKTQQWSRLDGALPASD